LSAFAVSELKVERTGTTLQPTKRITLSGRIGTPLNDDVVSESSDDLYGHFGFKLTKPGLKNTVVGEW
jgi:hypothetical protein